MRFKIFLTVFLVYLFYIAPDYITANTNRYIILTKSIVEDKTFSIDKYYQHTRDRGYHEGHYYMGAAPGMSFMAVPIYMALKPILKIIPVPLYADLEFDILNLFFTFFLALLPGALMAVMLYDMLGEFGLKEKEKVLIVFGASFGTAIFYYSTRFMTPVMGTFLLFSAFYLFFKHRNAVEKKYLSFLGGASLGAAVLVDASLIIGAALIFIYYCSFFRRDKVLNYLYAIIAILFMAHIHMFYHLACFSDPFTPAASYSSMNTDLFSFPKLKVIFELTFGTYRGVFLYMPILLISVYGILMFFRRPKKEYLKEVWLISMFSISVFLVVSSLKIWEGGGDFGPRYLIPFIPFLMIPVSFAYERLKFKTVFWITILSIFINWCGVQYGDSDRVFVDVGLFIFMGLNSNLAQWIYSLANTYVRNFKVITHFSPFVPFVILITVLYLIWKKEVYAVIHSDTGL